MLLLAYRDRAQWDAWPSTLAAVPPHLDRPPVLHCLPHSPTIARARAQSFRATAWAYLYYQHVYYYYYHLII